VIRLASLEDLPEMLALYRHLIPDDEAVEDPEVLCRRWEEMVSRPGLWVYVMCHAERLVSTCTLIVIPNVTRAGRPYAVIENVVTHRDYRRRGFGRATLEHAIRTALDMDCYRVTLVASPRNAPAKAFYESLGFDGSRTGYQIRNL